MAQKVKATIRSIVKKIRALRRAIGWKCFNCGKKVKCEFAHIKGRKTPIIEQTLAIYGVDRGRGSYSRYRDILDHLASLASLASYTYLCKTCHDIYDSAGENSPEFEARKNLFFKVRD